MFSWVHLRWLRPQTVASARKPWSLNTENNETKTFYWNKWKLPCIKFSKKNLIFSIMLLKPRKKHLNHRWLFKNIVQTALLCNPDFNSIINGRYMYAEFGQFRRYSISWQVDKQLKKLQTNKQTENLKSVYCKNN